VCHWLCQCSPDNDNGTRRGEWHTNIKTRPLALGLPPAAADNSTVAHATAAPELVIEHVAKEYPTSAGRPLRVLADVSFSLARGQSLAILGPSGSGKSTLLSIIGTLEPPTAGTVRLAGVDPFALDEPALAAFRARQIGFVFQDHHLLPQCTVLENVLVPLLADGAANADDQRHATALVERVGLVDRLDHRPAELSGGERQRVAIARALVRRPTLLLADEPTGNLDRTTAQSIANLLLELEREHNTILVAVTHSQVLAEAMQQRLELDAGRLVPSA
jgi:lipoprotein-releasing system ATP-binding protein